jgi:flagellar protein FliO/FliZ
MDNVHILTMLPALLFVLALMGLLWLGLKRFGLTTPQMPMGAKRRLKIIETLPLTAQHRAVLIARDDTTLHLVILGPNGETVVESSIKNHE